VRDQSEREAQLILREAHSEAERIVQSARLEAMRVVEQINSLVRMRRGYLTQFRVMLERHLAEIAAEEDLPDPNPRAILGDESGDSPQDGTTGGPRSGALFRG
jgi:hypothetical protein